MDKKLLRPIAYSVFDKLFTNYKKEAFRLETLPEYRVSGEDKELAYFKRHGRLPAELKFNPWEKLIGKARERGAQMWRIRRLSRKRTAYERYELACYKKQTELGLKVWTFTRDFGDLPEMNVLPFAFEYWMFDEKKIVFVQYDLTGQFMGVCEYLGPPKPYIALRNRLKRLSKRFV